jgi:hypothetical protein
LSLEDATICPSGPLPLLAQMGLLHVVDGHDCPSGEFFEMKVGRYNVQQ